MKLCKTPSANPESFRGYLQNSVWISPDPLAQEREILGGGKITVESLILLEARPCASSLAHPMGEGDRQAG